eukprot:scaffold30271_cov217-Amphora_coffeaeformis.AAC.1
MKAPHTHPHHDGGGFGGVMVVVTDGTSGRQLEWRGRPPSLPRKEGRCTGIVPYTILYRSFLIVI